MRAKRHGERNRRRSGRRSLGQWLRSADAKCTLVVAVGALLVFVLFCAASAPQRYSLRVGAISHQTITATKDVVDELTTENRRQAAADAVEPTYHLKEGASDEVMQHLAAVFDELRIVQQYGLTLRQDGESEEETASRTFTETELEYAQGLLKEVALTDKQVEVLLRTDTTTMENMIATVTTSVRNALNTTIREGQVTQSINNIQQIVGFIVDADLMQYIVPTVLKLCVAPNMVIDQEATALAQEKARESVEPVVYLQGQNIIREGERVTKNQVEMLRSLGMLKDNEYDYNVYVGAALLVLASVLLLVVLLRLLSPETLHDLRALLVLMTVLVITMGVSMLCIKGVNVYLAPITMASMLMTSLLGAPVGVAVTVPITLLVSGVTAGGNGNYATAMVHLMVMGIISGMFSVLFLKGKPQRVRVVLCGLVVAGCNLALMTAMGLMTSSDMAMVLNYAAWSMGSGVVGGLMAVALQPVFETTFNLATPSKLLELANPNQPLLRRLLLEAPGTYHHSIIVANLAEAAAEKIGANPLLARTGAYFHDVGKLKRPLYFKENQMGENPHDKTDPRVSTAILTEHTRDGVELARKHRLPEPIIDMIRQHHGDTPVMYFYAKAVKMLGEENVDIRDFRYDGPKPQTAEAAILMLSDTVEAAVRALPDPTQEKISALIRKLVRGKMEDGQLDECTLTFRDIGKICSAFETVLQGVFHERIEYPSVDLSRAQHHSEQKQAEQKTEAKP